MAQGIVKWFDRAKGIGQIAPDDGRGVVFVHLTAISVEAYRPFAAGQRVEFESMRGLASRQARRAAAL